MAVTTTQTNKPFNPRGNDQSPLAFNRAKLFSGKALDFDGVNDILTMPTALTSSLSTTSVTFVTNVKTDFATWSGTRDDAFSFAERGMILSFNGGNIYYYYRHQSSGWRNLQVPNADFKPQEWNQMVTTIDLNADTWKAYINGIEVATSGTYSDTAIAYDSNALTIGAQTGARFFDGQIAGFKLFNTALTAAQVADLYNNPEKVVPTGVDNTALKLWLPMQEGAGTTAYDGSGNGNHGTISGATYVHGIGAPVSQTAVIDWNKGTNIFTYSEALSNWTQLNTITTDDSAISPDGSQNASKLVATSGINNNVIYQGITAGTYTASIFAKKGEFEGIVIATGNVGAFFNLNTNTYRTFYGSAPTSYNIEDFGNGWHRFSITFTEAGANSIYIGPNDNVSITLGVTGNNSDGIYIFGTQLEQASSVGPYVRTGATAQTSPVLLPQGLTTGRDITGVNLFENVRKQGALNLDGNSWAEVHDNASLDFTTGLTLEAWVKSGDELDSVYDHIFVKQSSDSSWGPPYGRYVLRFRESNIQWWFDSVSNATDYSVALTGWNHLALTKNGTSEVLYLNGVQVDTNTGAATITASTYSLLIGSRTAHSAIEMIDNQLAQPRIYNRALTAEEVQRSYDSGKTIYTNS